MLFPSIIVKPTNWTSFEFENLTFYLIVNQYSDPSKSLNEIAYYFNSG